MEAVSGGHAWVRDGRRARRRDVVLGIHDLLRAEVISGLAEGDEVVVEGQSQLVEGTFISPARR